MPNSREWDGFQSDKCWQKLREQVQFKFLLLDFCVVDDEVRKPEISLQNKNSKKLEWIYPDDILQAQLTFGFSRKSKKLRKLHLLMWKILRFHLRPILASISKSFVFYTNLTIEKLLQKTIRSPSFSIHDVMSF